MTTEEDIVEDTKATTITVISTTTEIEAIPIGRFKVSHRIRTTYRIWTNRKHKSSPHLVQVSIRSLIIRMAGTVIITITTTGAMIITIGAMILTTGTMIVGIITPITTTEWMTSG